MRPLLQTSGSLQLPLPNPYERALAHEVATALGLKHLSKGEGNDRVLMVWVHGDDPPTSIETDTSSSSSKPKAKAQPAEKNDDADDNAETAIQAFERRAAALIAGLGPAQPAAEWKAPSDEELEILHRLARD